MQIPPIDSRGQNPTSLSLRSELHIDHGCSQRRRSNLVSPCNLACSLTFSWTDLTLGALGRTSDKLSQRRESARPQIDLCNQETEHVARCLPREQRRRPAAFKHPRKPHASVPASRLDPPIYTCLVQPSGAHPHARPAIRYRAQARSQDAQITREQALDQLCGRGGHRRRGVCPGGDVARGGRAGRTAGDAQVCTVHARE